MNLRTQINELKQVKEEGANKVFSMYLNTDPSDPDQQGGKWKIQLKNGLRNFETYLSEDENQEELRNFKKVKKKVKEFVGKYEQDLLRGIIVFATADGKVWFAERVQMRLESEFYWEEEPVLNQLEKLSNKLPKTGVILVQQNQIKVIETYLNEVENTHFYELNLDTENWAEKKGPRKANAVGAGVHPGSASMQKENFAGRFAANQQRWYKSIAPKLDKLAKDGAWENLYLFGERDAIHELRKQMNRKVNDTVYKNMLEHDEDKVLAQIS